MTKPYLSSFCCEWTTEERELCYTTLVWTIVCPIAWHINGSVGMLGIDSLIPSKLWQSQVWELVWFQSPQHTFSSPHELGNGGWFISIQCCQCLQDVALGHEGGMLVGEWPHRMWLHFMGSGNTSKIQIGLPLFAGIPDTRGCPTRPCILQPNPMVHWLTGTSKNKFRYVPSWES